MWTKSGDLTRTYNSGGPLNRYCAYSNEAANTVISELSIGGYLDGDYQIRAQASSTETYNRLKHAVISAGLPVLNPTSDLLKTLSISTSDRNRLCHFLNAMKQEEDSLSLIENEIATSLGLTNLNHVAALQTWNKIGSFTEINPVGGGSLLHRQVCYETGAQDSLIKKFNLLGYSNNTYMFCLNLSEQSNALKEVLRNSELDVIIDEHRSIARFCFNSNARAQFEQLLTLLSQHSVHFAEIKEDFKQHIAPVLSRVPTVLPTMTIFHHVNTAGNALPSIADNQSKLDACNFSNEIISTKANANKPKT